MEVVERGYGGQGNEFSYQMLLVSNYMLNHVFEPYSVFSKSFFFIRLNYSLGLIILTISLLQAIITVGLRSLILFLVKSVKKEVIFQCVQVNLLKVIKIKRMNGIVY